MELDIIWVVPVLIFVGVIWFVYRLGIEVGRQMEWNERREELRHYRAEIEQARSNVTPLFDTLPRRDRTSKGQ
jgi:hypothetical protein